MSRTLNKAIVLLVMLVLLSPCAAVDFAAGAEPEAQEPANEDVVHDEVALKDWLYNHEVIGGTVYFACDITLTSAIILNIQNEKRIIIDTGAYGLEFDGGYIISNSGYLEIMGEGVEAPVVDVVDTGWTWMTNWNNHLQRMNITANGKDGVGGTALRISAVDGKAVNADAFQKQGRIRSYGKNAVGLHLAVKTDAYCFTVSVEGEGSKAVYAPEGANLFFCKLSAVGAGATSVMGGDFVLDTCAVSPAAENARVISRHIESVFDRWLWLPVPQGGEDYIKNNIPDAGDVLSLIISADDGSDPFLMQIPVEWDKCLYTIDVYTPGTTRVNGTLPELFQGLGLEEHFPIELTVEVKNRECVCISNMWLAMHGWVRFDYWNNFSIIDDEVILWRSDDEGLTWYDSTRLENIVWTHQGYWDFYYSEINDPIQLKLEVVGKGESNVVTLFSINGLICGLPGGDRDGGDRVVVTEPGNMPDSGDKTGTGVPDNTNNTGIKREETPIFDSAPTSMPDGNGAVPFSAPVVPNGARTGKPSVPPVRAENDSAAADTSALRESQEEPGAVGGVFSASRMELADEPTMPAGKEPTRAAGISLPLALAALLAATSMAAFVVIRICLYAKKT